MARQDRVGAAPAPPHAADTEVPHLAVLEVILDARVQVLEVVQDGGRAAGARGGGGRWERWQNRRHHGSELQALEEPPRGEGQQGRAAAKGAGPS